MMGRKTSPQDIDPALLGGVGPEAGGLPPGPEGELPPGGELPPDMGAEAPMDIDSALSGLEIAVDSLPPDVAGGVREHVNAIRELISGGEGDEEIPDAEVPEEEPMPEPEKGA
jgi:hypothetical protein